MSLSQEVFLLEKPNVCMECAGVTLIHGCSTMEAFLDLVAMVPVGPSGAMCSVRHENDFAWKHAALRIECFCHAATHVFCLRLLWQEDHVLISICCTSTIHLHFRPHGKHSTHCANRSDPCRKAPAFSVPSDGAYRAYTLRRSWT